MDLINVEVRKVSDEAIAPQYKTSGSTVFDIYTNEAFLIKPNQTKMIATGLEFRIPENMQMWIRPDERMASFTNLTIPNSPDVIDSEYHGQLMIPIKNIAKEDMYQTDMNNISTPFRVNRDRVGRTDNQDDIEIRKYLMAEACAQFMGISDIDNILDHNSKNIERAAKGVLVEISDVRTDIIILSYRENDWYHYSSIITGGYSLDDGSEKIIQTIINPTEVESVAHGNDMVVCAMRDGRILQSTDGVNWILSHQSQVGVSVIYGNGLFFSIFGIDVRVSSNGLEWTSVGSTYTFNVDPCRIEPNSYYVSKGSRIAQASFHEVYKGTLNLVDSFTDKSK